MRAEFGSEGHPAATAAAAVGAADGGRGRLLRAALAR